VEHKDIFLRKYINSDIMISASVHLRHFSLL
jgi:hypothetical protein